MKPKQQLLFCFLFLCSFCKAQETVVLDTSMFDISFQRILITQMDGWKFKQGNDTNWSKIEIDTTGWSKLKPGELSVNNADKNGKVEGWFRIKFRLNSSFDHVPLGIYAYPWTATDVFIDGKYIRSFGNTGLNGKPYEEKKPDWHAPASVDISVGEDHVLALHLVDYVAPWRPSLLKSNLNFFGISNDCIVFTGPSTHDTYMDYRADVSNLWGIILSVYSICLCLFWFIYLQNRQQKVLLTISIVITCFGVGTYFNSTLFVASGLSFHEMNMNNLFRQVSFEISIALTVLFFAQAFNRKILRVGVVGTILFALVSLYDDVANLEAHAAYIIIVYFIIYVYIIISARKNMRGAQWAILIGWISVMVFSFLWYYNVNRYGIQFPFPFWSFYAGGIFLSVPVSLVVYVAMRFNEMLIDVQMNAKQVLQLIEEKKEQALKQQKILEEEVARQTIELRTSFENLKSTQAQLIQSEKMASLGELTAGIAHEIQNPLNFVNNFSDVNQELIEELKAERLKPKAERDEQLEDDLLNDIKDNEIKINHHGKRADAIVKSMLEHSRTSTGIKEPADINKLADEYLRLAYHGLRAKDKEFNAEIKTVFDEAIGNINVVPQDIGRVLLNLYNNAFYAVGEKQKAESLKPTRDGNKYEPNVTVSTKKADGKIIISVKDNGNGISEKIKEKIFQPFFTTKPTGSGTGLGLSLSYDIIKAHGGEIKVKTKEEEGTEFSIVLPT